MVNRVILTAIAMFLWVYASIWCFNHINAWIGIATFILGTYILIKKLEKSKNN